jgi:hypothetical protein
VHEQVQAAQAADGLFDAADGFLRLGTIGQEQFTPPPGGGDGAPGFVRIGVLGPADNGDVGTGLGEGECGGGADTTGAAGDEGDFVPELQRSNFSTSSP